MTVHDARRPRRRTVPRAALAAGGVIATAPAMPAFHGARRHRCWRRTGCRADRRFRVPVPAVGVELLADPLWDNTTRAVNYLSFVDQDRPHTFRLTVGLPSNAQPYGGWEAPDVELRGPSTGHLMSALAQAYANTGAADLKTA